MTENKRFTTDNGSHEDVCLVDNLTKKEYESNFEDMVSLMNDIWNQTQRFEKHNQRLEKENEQLKSKYYWYKQYKELLNENEQLKQLLREVEHELTSLTGLSCFDKCASQLGYVEVFDDDRIDLDYSDLLKKIEKVILND